MSLASIFFGVPQSRYAAIAILVAIVVVSLVIIFGKDTIPMSQKFGFVLLVALISLPSLALSLFQMTCIVTGAGFKDQRWWCGAYAWILSAIMIAYSALLVVSAVMSLAAGSPADIKQGFVSTDEANEDAEEYFANDGKKFGGADLVQHFADGEEEEEENFYAEAASNNLASATPKPPSIAASAPAVAAPAVGAAPALPQQFTVPPPNTPPMQKFGVPTVFGDTSTPAPAGFPSGMVQAPMAPSPVPSAPETFSASYGSIL